MARTRVTVLLTLAMVALPLLAAGEGVVSAW
jgi:hypothetical protein